MRNSLFTVALFAIMGIAVCQYNYCDAPAPNYSPSQDVPGGTLEMVQIVTRHGDRVPSTFIKTLTPVVTWNCTANRLYDAGLGFNKRIREDNRLYREIYPAGYQTLQGNCALAQLTGQGVVQMEQLGSEFNSLYVNRLRLLQTITSVYARSTNFDRTKLSAAALLDNLVPCDQPLLGDEAVPVEVREIEDLLPGLCPQYNARLNQLFGSPAFQQKLGENQALIGYLAVGLNMTSTFSVNTISDLFDITNAIKCNNLQMPTLITPAVFDQIASLVNWAVSFEVNDTTLSLYGSGSFVRTLSNNIANFLNGNRNTELFYFSAHDSSLESLLGTLGVYPGQIPPYASHFELELWSKHREYFVQVKYNGQTLTIPGLPQVVPVAQFQAFLQTRIPTDC